jgi:hypothetical protein
MMSFTDEAWGKEFPFTSAEEFRALAREKEGSLFVVLPPAEAQKMLAELGRKPVIAPTRVASYAREMRMSMDRTRLSLGSVRVGVARDGRLGDGDTLLTAVARAGKPVLLAMRFGVEEPGLEHFRAPKRRESQSVQAAGIKDVARISALSNLLVEYAVGRELVKKPRLSAEAIIGVVNEDAQLRFAVDHCMRFRAPFLRGTVGAFCLYALTRAAGQEKALEFLDLDRGKRFPTQVHNPVLMLRDRLMEEGGRKTPAPRDTQIGWCIEAVVKHLAGEPMKKPSWKRGPWPRVPGLVMPEVVEREAARIREEIDAATLKAA